jgi:hypothetical protein
MYDSYVAYINQLQADGIELFCHFNDAQAFNVGPFGSWGCIDNIHTPTTSPTAQEYNALVQFLGADNPNLVQMAPIASSTVFYSPAVSGQYRRVRLTVSPP